MTSLAQGKESVASQTVREGTDLYGTVRAS